MLHNCSIIEQDRLRHITWTIFGSIVFTIWGPNTTRGYLLNTQNYEGGHSSTIFKSRFRKITICRIMCLRSDTNVQISIRVHKIHHSSSYILQSFPLYCSAVTQFGNKKPIILRDIYQTNPSSLWSCPISLVTALCTLGLLCFLWCSLISLAGCLIRTSGCVINPCNSK